MKRLAAIVAITLSTLSLSGCEVFYPNWGATTAPVETPTESASSTPEPSDTPSPSEKPKQAVSVSVLQADTDAAAGTITVIAQATGIAEDGGTCTLTVTQGATTKSISAKAESNVSDTQCYPLTLSIVGLAPGDASFTVSYSSNGYTGKSNPSPVTVP